MKTNPFQKLVYAACRKIPKGRVSTYQAIARAIGKPKSARAVGNALNKNPFALASIRQDVSSSRSGPKIPCHRVVKSDGTIGGFAQGSKNKIKMLEKEGVKIKNGKINEFKEIFFKFS